MIQKFKKFIANDNVISLAVGVIMGTAFTAIVNSLVDDIFMPLIVAITGQADVSGIAFTLGNTQIAVGHFLQAIINFFLISLFLFFILEGLEKIMPKQEEEEAPAGPSETELLEEILAELKKEA